MLLAAHCLELGRRHDDRVRGQPHDEAGNKNKHHVLDVLLIPLRTAHPLHPLPQIVISREKEGADHDCLNDEQPRQQSAHQGNAHLLPVSIDLPHQPITRKGQRNQEADPDEHGDIAHPIVMRAFLIGLGREKPIRGVCGHDPSTKRHIAEKPMDINRIPQRGMDHMPDVAQIATLRIHAGRGLHKGDP